MVAFENVNFEIKRDSSNNPYLYLTITRDGEIIFQINKMPFKKGEINDTTIDFLEILIDQLKNNKHDFKSGDIEDSYMIEKYGRNFLNSIAFFDEDDFTYFSVSVFIGSLVIVAS